MYNAIVGSRSYGIALNTSDVDIGFILSEVNRSKYGSRVDLWELSEWEFMRDMIGPQPEYFFTQYLFPQSFEEDTALSQYILENREAIIKARSPIVYKTLKRRGDDLYVWSDKLYKVSPKRMAYSTLFYSILANYAEGMPFAQAHRPEGELHDFLVGIRLGQVPLEEAMARNKSERQRVEKAAEFYKEAVHPEILLEFEQIILEEAEKGRRNTHA